jgi:hypothetical protein
LNSVAVVVVKAREARSRNFSGFRPSLVPGNRERAMPKVAGPADSGRVLRGGSWNNNDPHKLLWKLTATPVGVR